VGTLLQAGFEVGHARLQHLDLLRLLLEAGQQMDDQVLQDEGHLIPGGSVQRKPFWKRQRVGHTILPCLMNLPFARASDPVVIAKTPAKGQYMLKGIPLAGSLPGYPLNNY
jgi:hypothetical protein